MDIKDKLKTLPTKPGCYLMKDKNGKVIYVGKAIVLKNRVNSYFKGVHDYKTSKLVSNICDFDYIVVDSEKEALILEYNLIKKYDPYYNIVFKDDKSYPYILLKEGDIPYIEAIRLTKNNKKIKGNLFGPYPDVGAARNTVDLINKLFLSAKCKKMGKELCLYYHMGQCLGYCKKDFDVKKSRKIKKEIISFLNGDTSKILKELRNNMEVSSTKLDFERAKYYRDLIDDVKISTSKQVVEINCKESFDVFNYDVLDGMISINGLFIRNGILQGNDKMLDYLVGDSQNMVSSYIYQYYQINPRPKTLYVEDDLLDFLKIDGINIISPKRGNKKGLLNRARENAKENLRQNKDILLSKNKYYEDVNEELKEIFNRSIKRIELFDNSHTAGINTVGAMVVYKDLKPSKKEYRLYKLDEGANDLKSMHEMIYRRYLRAIKDDLEMPDLIIVDGGKNQIEVAKKVLEELNLDILLCGLGKDDKHNTAYLMNKDFLKIDIDPRSNLFLFLANAQDEVHRFAITYHKKIRSKATYKSILDDVDGLGEKYRLRLLKKYKSISKIKTLSIEELNSILPINVATRLYNKLVEKNDD